MNKKRRRHDDDEHMDESWLIPYADILTLLLALFIVLFSSSQIDQKKFDEIKQSFNAALNGGPSFFQNISPVPNTNPVSMVKNQDSANANIGKERRRREEEEDLQELQRKINQYIEENNLTTQLETHLDSEQLRITIRDHALFNSGSAQLRPESRDLAGAISDLLAQYPEYEVIVAGHTDNVPIRNSQFPSNFHLSTERALNFMAVLLENPDVHADRFSSAGYGEYKPIADNNTPEGREQNRRVEVSIVRTIQ